MVMSLAVECHVLLPGRPSPQGPVLGWHLCTPFGACLTQGAPAGRAQGKALGLWIRLQRFVFLI